MAIARTETKSLTVYIMKPCTLYVYYKDREEKRWGWGQRKKVTYSPNARTVAGTFNKNIFK